MATATKAKPFRLLGSKSETSKHVHEAILAGLPFATLARFLKHYKASGDAILESLSIDPKRLALRKASGKLTLEESNRFYRLANLLALATELYEGDAAGALTWLNSPARSLSGDTPFQRARTEVGAREVENLIGRLEHGVFS